jgi:Aerobic-type carbon monoxide dehydrogenase, small subunit CoxS/CutS homologs
MSEPPELVTIRIKVNGVERELQVRPHERLLDVLRNRLHILSVRGSCEQGSCGLCTVLVNGRPMKSCMVLAHEVDGAEITTVEGISNLGEITLLQRKFIEHFAFQCGFCTPAFVLVGHYLLNKHKRLLTREEVAEGISGLICRCTGYKPIIDAIVDASREMYGKNV